MYTATVPAAPATRQTRARALCAAGGAAAAAIAWVIEVPLLGVHLTVRFGAMHPQTVALWQAVVTALVAALLGWLLLAVLGRRTARARAAWTGISVLVLAASLALPLTAATTASAAAGLAVLHLAVGVAVIPGMARTS